MKRLISLLMLVSFACRSNEVPATVVRTLPPPIVVISTRPAPTIYPTLSPTPSPYEQYSIDHLRRRTYGGGKIEITKTMETNETFTRYLIRYPSDGLNIVGFANVPKGKGPFPVIIAIHGYVDPAIYETLDYTTPVIDSLTEAGYIVIHPNLRNFPPSDNGDNLFRVGMAVDVLNLIALVKSEAGPAELFATADPEKIGLFGHSMGGSIALRVLTISSVVKATILYAPMSGDELKNAQLFFNGSKDPTYQVELSTQPAVMEQISPLYYYKNITSPIQLHHGTADQTVPVAWATETCNALTAAGVQIECIYYPGEDHTFRRRVADQFWSAMMGFYQKYLSP